MLVKGATGSLGAVAQSLFTQQNPHQAKPVVVHIVDLWIYFMNDMPNKIILFKPLIEWFFIITIKQWNSAINILKIYNVSIVILFHDNYSYISCNGRQLGRHFIKQFRDTHDHIILWKTALKPEAQSSWCPICCPCNVIYGDHTGRVQATVINHQCWQYPAESISGMILIHSKWNEHCYMFSTCNDWFSIMK